MTLINYATIIYDTLIPSPCIFYRTIKVALYRLSTRPINLAVYRFSAKKTRYSIIYKKD